MAREFRLPDIGEGLTEAEVVRWLIPVGGEVAVDETVVEVETDKAVVEIPSPYGGVVLHHGAGEGEVVEVGQVLVVVGDPGETWPPGEDSEPAPIVGTLSSHAEELPSRGEQITRIVSSAKALPLVRKLAKDLGVDLESVAGSGPDGRITREDVLAAAEESGEVEAPPAPSLPPVPQAPPPVAPPRDGERRPLSKLRRTIAANMTESWTTVPHVTTFDEVDATRLMAMRAALGRRHGVSIPVDALIVKAVIPALVAFPEFNASLDGDDLILSGRHDIGIAVDTPDGLLVAVIRDAGERSLLSLAEEVRRLGEGAKERRLNPGELSGQTFTVSNIGAVGGGWGTPLVPPGTIAILSAGRAADKPVAREGRVEIAPMMPLSLSYDHRVIDGGLGRRFMAMVLENLAEPGLFLAD